MKAVTLCTAALVTVLASAQALADHEENSVILRIGSGRVSPGDDSNWLRLGGTRLADNPVTVDASGNTAFTGAWLIADRRGVGLLAAIPFDRARETSGLPGPAGAPSLERPEFASFGQLPPLLAIQWFPGRPGSSVRPYVGLGMNYMAFIGWDISRAANGYLFTRPDTVGSTSPKRVGLTGELGVDISLGRNKRWLVNAAVWYLDGEAEPRTPVEMGAGRIEPEADEAPWVYSLGIGYRF